MAGRKWGASMMNIMEINGYQAIIQYDPDIDMFRGEFIGLNGGADFYAKDIENLRKEGEISLQVFLDMCREDGVEPRKEYSGKFNLRLPTDLHAELAIRAASSGKSMNQLVTDLLAHSLQAESEIRI
jgi:predicted HicB family RNase H-like nuclease